MDIGLTIPAFMAGVLTFLAPCTLPLVPGYLAFISAIPPTQAGAARGRVFRNGLLFVIGFGATFTLLGTLVGIAGSAVAPYRWWLGRIGGVLIILFGLMTLGAVRIPVLNRERRWRIPAALERGNPLTSFLLGVAFAVGWTPCVGPVLTAILVLASVSATAPGGALLLGVFSLGLAVPFLAVAAGAGAATRVLTRFSGAFRVVSVAGGILLIFLGILLLTDRMVLFIAESYRLLNFIRYDRILDSL